MQMVLIRFCNKKCLVIVIDFMSDYRHIVNCIFTKVRIKLTLYIEYCAHLVMSDKFC